MFASTYACDARFAASSPLVKDLDLFRVHLKGVSGLPFEVRIHLEAKLFIALFVVNADRHNARRSGSIRKESSRIKTRRVNVPRRWRATTNYIRAARRSRSRSRLRRGEPF